MAKIQSVDTMVDVPQPTLDMRRPVADVASLVEKTVGVLEEVFKPKNNLGDILAQSVQRYNENMGMIEATGEMSNTQIASLNRQTKADLTQQMIKAGADAKTMNQYLSTMKDVFESDDRYATIDKGSYTMTTSYGDKAKTSVNDPQEMQMRAAADMLGSMPPAAQVYYSKLSPEEQESFRDTHAMKHFMLEQLKMDASLSDKQASVFEWDNTQRKQRDNQLYGTYYFISQSDMMAKQKDLIAKVAGGYSPSEAVALQKIWMDDYKNSSEFLSLVRRNPDLMTKLDNDMNMIALTEEDFKSLGTDLDNLEGDQLGLHLARQISFERTFAGLTPNMQQLINLKDILGKNPMSFSMMDKQLTHIGGGQLVRWSYDTNDFMRDTFGPMMEPLYGQELDEETMQSGRMVRGSLYQSMQMFSSGQPLNSKMNAEDVVVAMKELRDTKYYQSLSKEDTSKFEHQYSEFEKSLRKKSPGIFQKLFGRGGE